MKRDYTTQGVDQDWADSRETHMWGREPVTVRVHRPYSVRITVDGVVYPIYRDVAHVHPGAVHAALGTASEAELQRLLDQVSVHDYYDADGVYRGPDPYGLEVTYDDEQ